jgi:cytochrome c2
MIRSSRLAWTFGLVMAVSFGPAAGPAFAIKQFADEFKEVYVKDGSPLATAVEAAKCNVCHVGKNKKDRNAYGEELAKLLDKKTDKEDKAKIKQALEAVAKLPSKEAGKTFGDLIAAGQLPGGPAE